MKRDLSEFERLTENGANWEDRLVVIRDHFPSTNDHDLDWAQAFSADWPDLMGRVVKDLLKISMKGGKGRSGPRKAPDYDAGMQELRELFGLDYSTLEFDESLRALAFDETPEDVAERTGLELKQIKLLLDGKERPSLWEMMRIAEAYGKRPGYFADYRTLFIASAIAEELDRNPEWSMAIYQRMRTGQL